MPSPTSANSVEQRCSSNRESFTIEGFTPITLSGSSEPTHETCESSSLRSWAQAWVSSSGCLSRRDAWNSCPSLVRNRDFHSHVCRHFRSISLRRENETHLFRGCREHPRSVCYMLRKDRRAGRAAPFRLRAFGGIQTFSPLFLDGANISKRNPFVRNPRGYFPLLVWFRRLGVAASCGVGRSLLSLGRPRPPPLAESARCLASHARLGVSAPSMIDPAG